MASNKNVSQVQRLFEEVYTGGNLNSMNDILADNVRLNDPSIHDSVRGLKAVSNSEAEYQSAFKGKKASIDNVYTSGETVIVHWTCTGTHNGTFRGMRATNKKFSVSGISIYTFSNGKISEITQVWDTLGLLEQLGAVSAERLAA